MQVKKILVNLLVLGAAGLIGLGLCELGARLVLRPADYLSVEMVHDDILGAVPSKGTRSGGFDDWGFRNREVPASADIVTLGDSHTYGNTATMEDSWPYALGRLSGQRVYNLGLGGYGPNQYFAVFKSRGFSLKPKLILCGLYMGDDFENAYLITYGLEHWAYLRELPAEKVDYNIWETAPDTSWHKPIRLWLSRHSVIYQLVVHGPLAARFRGEGQIKSASRRDSDAVTLDLPDKHILEAFLPEQIGRRLDQNDPRIREGMRITFKLLKEMADASRQHDVRFMVVVIPTKEMVFSDYLERDPSLPLKDVVQKLLANERVARDKTFAFLTESGIPYVDALPKLKAGVQNQLYARGATDMHPGKNGYYAIAEAVHEALQRPQVSR